MRRPAPAAPDSSTPSSQHYSQLHTHQRPVAASSSTDAWGQRTLIIGGAIVLVALYWYLFVYHAKFALSAQLNTQTQTDLEAQSTVGWDLAGAYTIDNQGNHVVRLSAVPPPPRSKLSAHLASSRSVGVRDIHLVAAQKELGPDVHCKCEHVRLNITHELTFFEYGERKEVEARVSRQLARTHQGTDAAIRQQVEILDELFRRHKGKRPSKDKDKNKKSFLETGAEVKMEQEAKPMAALEMETVVQDAKHGEWENGASDEWSAINADAELSEETVMPVLLESDISFGGGRTVDELVTEFATLYADDIKSSTAKNAASSPTVDGATSAAQRGQ